MQERLMELGYMDNDEPTQLFGPATKNAVQLFQRKNSLDIDGCVGDETWNLLFSDQAQKYLGFRRYDGNGCGTDAAAPCRAGIPRPCDGLFRLRYDGGCKTVPGEKQSESGRNIGENTRELLSLRTPQSTPLRMAKRMKRSRLTSSVWWNWAI